MTQNTTTDNSDMTMLKGRLLNTGIDLSHENCVILLDFLKKNNTLMRTLSPKTKSVFYKSLNDKMFFSHGELESALDNVLIDDSKEQLNKKIVRAFNQFMEKIDSAILKSGRKGYKPEERSKCLDFFIDIGIVPDDNTCYPHILQGQELVLTVQDNYLWLRDLFAKQISAEKIALDIYTKSEWNSLENCKELSKGRAFNVLKPEQAIFPSAKTELVTDTQGVSRKRSWLDDKESNIAYFVIYPIFHDGRDSSRYVAYYSYLDIKNRAGDNVKGCIWNGGQHNMGQMLSKHVIRMYLKSFVGTNSVITAIDIFQASAEQRVRL